MLSVSSQSSSFLPSATQFAERLNANRLNGNEVDGQSDKKSTEQQPKVDASAELSELSEQRQLQTLKARDQEVRAHELAHASVGGQFASAPSFTYQKGSDGVLYAVGGEVSISTSAVSSDPKATLEKAQTIQRAALAPANPSSQDRAVAANAAALAQKAQIDIAKLQQIENTRENSSRYDADSSNSNNLNSNNLNSNNLNSNNLNSNSSEARPEQQLSIDVFA